VRLVLPALLILLVVIGVGPHVLDSLPGCGLNRLTGLHCPGCGSTRAVNHLLRGDLRAAVGDNSLLVLGAPLLAIGWVWHARRLSRAGRSRGEVPRWAIYTILVVVVSFWILRNVNLYPFTLLAP
jgi:hypothetical protein